MSRSSPYHFGIAALLLVILLWSLWGLVQPLVSAGAVFTFERVIWVLLSLALIGTYLYARLFPLAAQDRIIRLEMHLRLKEVLPEDLQDRIEELTPGQLIGLRFASDGEMPDLLREVLDRGIADRDEIKKKIKDWRGDYLRV